MISHQHNNFITITGATNIFACFPSTSERCSRVTTISIAKNNTFDCKDENIGIFIINVFDYADSANCSGKRVNEFGYLSSKPGSFSLVQVKSDNCPRVKRFH